MTIGDILEELRKDKKLTQKELGKILNVGGSTVGGYESEDIALPIDSLKTLSLYYNVSSDYILGITRDKTSWKDLNLEIQTKSGKVTVKQLLNEFQKLNQHDKDILIEIMDALKLKYDKDTTRK